jgi:alkylation response protein AidB-like acyl-CoA dehydrogenase
MHFELTDEQLMIQSAAHEFAREEIAPVAALLDSSGEFPVETVRQMGQQGFMGIEVPEEYGGVGMDTIAYVLAMD